MKTKALLMTLLLLLTAGCSSDDENYIVNPDKYPIFGYWLNTGAHFETSTGLYFANDGKIKSWQRNLNGAYSETPWGELEVGIDGTLGIRSYLDEAASVDALYYKIHELTKERLVIRVWGGFAGTSYEEGLDLEYQKLKSKPTNKS
ncbi:MAG: hypothetical protein IKX25_04395 [Bacteroidales bacterium]|nr:hypothetical protein [Bacteroidales bacterium]